MKKVHALDADYIIYLTGCDLFYEITPELTKSLGSANLGSADAALARINWLLDRNQAKGSREYKFNFSTLELAADAFEMFFRKETTGALEILKGIHDKLQAKEEGQRRLMYQLGTLVIASLVWSLYLGLRGRCLPAAWDPWMLAAALAMAGGLFSVCLNIESLEVNVNRNFLFLFLAGTTRSVVALLAGIGLLLAMRSNMFAGITYPSKSPPAPEALLTTAEMFFCFLAGFSEYFVPNILSKAAADKADEAKRKQADADAKAKSEADAKMKSEADAKAKIEADKNKVVGAP